jgi:hypothetical protein
MNVEQILATLIEERSKIEKAIEALERGWTFHTPHSTVVGPKRKRHVSAAARKRMAEGQRKRWAALKAGK